MVLRDGHKFLVLRLENALTVEPPFRAAHSGLKPGATMNPRHPIQARDAKRCDAQRTTDKGQPFLNFLFHHLPRNQPLLRMAFDDFFQKVACFAAAGGRFFLLQPLLQRLTAGGLNHH